MIKFSCNNCGQKFRVPEDQAGKKGTCPKCKNVVVIPEIQSTSPAPEQSGSEEMHVDSKFSAYDLTLLEGPMSDEDRGQPVGETNENGIATEHAGKNTQRSEENEDGFVTERRFPWPVDIFLYPACKSSLTIVAMILVIRWFSILILRGLGYSTPSLSPMVVIVVPLLCISILVRVVLYMYYYWYLCECIRDSAEGGVRAPETFAKTPGIGEMLWLFLRTLICLVLFAAPGLCYYLSVRQTDAVFWIWFVFGGLFLPMGLLACVMFDSISGLNPILLIGSIRSTFLPYCAMISVFLLAGFFVINNVLDADFSLLQRFVIHCITLYLLIVVAHLLGWFYSRYQEKLNWNV